MHRVWEPVDRVLKTRLEVAPEVEHDIGVLEPRDLARRWLELVWLVAGCDQRADRDIGTTDAAHKFLDRIEGHSHGQRAVTVVRCVIRTRRYGDAEGHQRDGNRQRLHTNDHIRNEKHYHYDRNDSR